MYTLLLGLLVGIITGYLGFLIYPSYVLAGLTFVAGVLVFNFFMGRYFMKKITEVFNSTEKDIKAGKADIAIEKIKTGYKYSKWQFLVREQIDSQIGIILYANKRFDEALPYLKKSLKSNWMAMSMLAAYYYKQKDYANMKAVMENCHVQKRVRLILGLNEEKNWNCIKHYKKVEESPTLSFSPDADFPCIYAEKSILNCYINMPYSNSEYAPITIKEVNCNNNALNVVPKSCTIVLKINDKNIPISKIITTSQEVIKNFNFEIEVHKLNDVELKLISHGIQAHGAHPDLGINSISRLILVVNEIFKQYNTKIELFDFFQKYINTEYNGKSLGINFEDESGKLTLNIGNLSLENSILKFGMNIRIPINTQIDIVSEAFIKYCNIYPNLTFTNVHSQQALYIPKDTPLVQTLCKIFNEVTHSSAEPIAIGGATYARAFKNCVSFGPNFPGQQDMCHQTDEFIDINNLMLSCKIYAKAIEELSSKKF